MNTHIDAVLWSMKAMDKLRDAIDALSEFEEEEIEGVETSNVSFTIRQIKLAIDVLPDIFHSCIHLDEFQRDSCAYKKQS